MIKVDVLFEAAPDAIIITDSKGIITRFNAQAGKMFGYAREEILGKPIETLIPQRYGESHETHRAHYVKQPVTRPMGQCLGLYGLKKDGTEFAVDISISPMKTDDGIFVVSFLRNIPARRSADKQGQLFQETALTISAAKNFQDALHAAVQTICEFTNWIYGEVWILSDDKTHLKASPVWYSHEKHLDKFYEFSRLYTFKPGEGLPGTAWEEKHSQWLDDVSASPLYLRAEKAKEFGLKAGAAIPILSGGDVVGIMAFYHTLFRKEDHDLMKAVSAVSLHLGTLLEKKQTEDELERKTEELSVHNEILRVIHSTPDLQERLDLILKEIVRFLNMEHGGLHLIQGDEIVLKSHHNLPDNLRAQVLAFPLDAPPPWAKGTDIVNEHLSEKGITPDFVKKEGMQSWVSFALHLPPHEKEEGEWIGCLAVGSRQYNALQEARVSVVRKLVPQISTAIDNARTYRMAQERLVRLRILREIDKAIIQHLNIQDIMRVVLERLPKNLGADAAAICLVERATWKMETCVMRLPDGTECTERAFTLAESLLDKFMNKKETVIIYDINEDPRLQMHLEHTQCAPFMSYLGVPLIVHNDTIGVLHILTLQPKRFANEDVSFFRTLAGQTAIALENAQLFNRVKAQAEASAELVRQLEVAHEELRAAQEHIIQQERLRALGQMASGIAHDFNSALSPILGFTELLLLLPPEQFAEKAKNYLEMIKTSAQDAAETVKRLREFYRAREKEEKLSAVDINEIITHVINITQPRWKGMAQTKSANILIRKELQDVPRIRGNESELREALTNFIFNAVDAMPEGGEIVISTCTKETEEGATCVCVSVTDTGDGMTEDVKNHCLDPFFTTKKETGTGLGLSMVHGIIQRHDGKLQIESEPGKGTTFHIEIPVHEGNGNKKYQAAAQEMSARQLSILVVDDEPSIRMVLEEYAKALGHTAESAANVSEAKLWLETKSFDAVITDRSMPGESGDRLAAFIKQKWTELPVILLTGFGDMMQSEGEKVEGVDEILSKPVTLSSLRAALERVT